VQLYSFFNLGNAPATLPPTKTPGTHCTGGWFASGDGLEGCGNSCPTRIRSPDRPALSESQYRLHYPGTSEGGTTFTFRTDEVFRTEEGGSRLLRLQWYSTVVPNHTTLDSSLNTDCRGECESSDIHLDSLLGRGMLPIDSCCGFCR
jgi:hypothetical protein